MQAFTAALTRFLACLAIERKSSVGRAPSAGNAPRCLVAWRRPIICPDQAHGPIFQVPAAPKTALLQAPSKKP